MKSEMDRYRYIATAGEYCNFCLELLARGAAAQKIKATLLRSVGTAVKASYTRFASEAKSQALKFRKQYGIRYTVKDLENIMERARIEYEQSNGDLDRYLSSDVVQEFKVRFMGNRLDDWEMLEYWVNLFGSTFPEEDEHDELVGSSDVVLRMPAFDDYDVTPVVYVKVSNDLTDCRFNSHYWRYFKAPVSVIRTITRECPAVSVRFTPTKFMLLGYSLSYIAFDQTRYRTNDDKYRSIFRLMEFVFGELTSRELIWITHSVFLWISRLPPALGLMLFKYDITQWEVALKSIKHLASSESKYRVALNSLEIVKGIGFTDEVKESLKIYRAESKISK
jgi:hypothetical protein